MEILEAFAFVALGFVPTLLALELSWKMGRIIGKRGEVAVPKVR